MSNILSYNKKATGEGWIDSKEYSLDEINAIHDSEGGRSEAPKTAIPSPFAQMDLVKNAFAHLSMTKDLQRATLSNGEVIASAMDERLVSYALDIGQLFFNYSEKKDFLRIIPWKKNQIEELIAEPSHKLIGDTLKMFIEQDGQAYNFDKMTGLYFLIYGNKVIGSTSPTTLFMASPNATGCLFNIPVEEGINLFDKWRPLYYRNHDFIKYLYRIFGAYPNLKNRDVMDAVSKYLNKCFELLPADLRKEIIEEIGNPQAKDVERQEQCRGDLERLYDSLPEGVEVIGVPLYQIKSENILNAIKNSDFVIAPTVIQEEAEILPLVLQNNLNAPSSDPFKYITHYWDDNRNKFSPKDFDSPISTRILPQTNHPYPWVTVSDFMQPEIIELDFLINDDCFFDGNMKASNNVENNGFLLPLKPLFFKYFTVEDLKCTINGHRMFEMQHGMSGGKEVVIATLRIPVKKDRKYITLTCTYKSDNLSPFNQETNSGRIVKRSFTLSLFPFAKVKNYQLMFINRIFDESGMSNVKLKFFKNGNHDITMSEPRGRSRKANMKSDFYNITDNFDYIQLDFIGENNAASSRGYIVPLWSAQNENTSGAIAYTFAVDLGTTNTHVEIMKEQETPIPLTINPIGSYRLVSNLNLNEDPIYDAIIKQEFLPTVIGTDYTFPQRTVLSESENLDAENADLIVALGDANIPFIYEKEHVGFGNRIVPNLKWSTDIANNKRLKAYMTEIAMLMKTRSIFGDGNLAQTKLVWFYPLSMKVGNVINLDKMWHKTFSEVFGIQANESNVIKMPESIAPYYYYIRSNKYKAANYTVVSIDIGGGTSDVVVFEPGSKEPTLVTSFRFAANALFGDAFADIPQGDTNPMLKKYIKYFENLFNQDEKYEDIKGVLQAIREKKHSEDINAFLFSIESNKIAKGNDNFSYNVRLNEDTLRKPIFIYFYCTIIYYVVTMMKSKSLDKPRNIMFSGTGSKVLNIVANESELDRMTEVLIEKIYGEQYGEDGFSIVMEQNAPKQITCRGALLQVKDKDGIAEIEAINKRLDSGYRMDEPSVKINYSMIGKDNLIYKDMDNYEIQNQIIDSVKKYNEFFINFFEEYKLADRFSVDNCSWSTFKEVINKDLMHYLVQGWEYVNRNQDKNENDVIEDALFFYPIIGSIRCNLIENLKESE